MMSDSQARTTAQLAVIPTRDPNTELMMSETCIFLSFHAKLIAIPTNPPDMDASNVVVAALAERIHFPPDIPNVLPQLNANHPHLHIS